MTREEHRERHAQFHALLDEMVAEFVQHGTHPGDHLPSRTTLLDFMRWATQQKTDPTPCEGEG